MIELIKIMSGETVEDGESSETRSVRQHSGTVVSTGIFLHGVDIILLHYKNNIQ